MPRLFVYRVEGGHFYIDTKHYKNVSDAVSNAPGFVSGSYYSPLFDSLDLSVGESCAIIIYRDKRDRS